ncbi:MAG: ribosome biogenesis GTPase Der [Candidatus Brocadiia bacterium]
MPRRDIALPASLGPIARGDGSIPSVVIVGRPNVGKSSLLNCLARQRIAIVDPTAGVTRDRISAVIEHNERLFELWDTGGIGTPDDLAAEVESQIDSALERADVVLFLVDAQQGLMPLDEEIGARLRRLRRPVMLVANKVEHPKHEAAAAEFYTLGFGAPIFISALNGTGRTDLLTELTNRLPETHTRPSEPVLKLAVVGRQNVGKSTLVNTLVGEQRVIVSDIPGTTRDAVDVRFEHNGQTFVAVDTAGLKRHSKGGNSIEFYGLVRAYRAIRRCNVALLMIDASSEISRVDKRLATAIEDSSKPCVITVNKWDRVAGKFTTEEYVRYLGAHLTGLSFAPISFISAKENTNIERTLDLAQALFKQAGRQIGTPELNDVLHRAAEAKAPEGSHGKHPRLFYGTQIAVAPPTFLIFASHPQLISAQYTRYLANDFRRHLPFPEVPIRIVYRARTRKAEPADEAR